MGLFVVCVALFLAIFVFAGILLAYIAFVDWKTRLISLRALALLVGLRVSLAVSSLVIASCVTAPQEQSFDWLFILVDQLSFASLVFSSVGSLSFMVVLMGLSALVEVFLRKSKQRQRVQNESCMQYDLYAQSKQCVQKEQCLQGQYVQGKQCAQAKDTQRQQRTQAKDMHRQQRTQAKGAQRQQHAQKKQRAPKKQRTLPFGRTGTLQTLRSSRRHSKEVAKGAYSFVSQDSSEALGRGDVKLIGASCLFLSLGQLPIFLVIMTLSSLVVMAYFLLRFRDKTFPFAPCIVLATLVTFML